MKHQGMTGFTLMELMIALVVVAILSSIALPSYQDYIRRAARTEAKTTLEENRLVMEQAFTTNNTYIADPQKLAFPTSPKSGTAKYNLSVEAVTATSYTLKAVPVDSKDKCGTFLIDNTGLRSLKNNAANASVGECWGNG